MLRSCEQQGERARATRTVTGDMRCRSRPVMPTAVARSARRSVPVGSGKVYEDELGLSQGSSLYSGAGLICGAMGVRRRARAGLAIAVCSRPEPVTSR